MTKSKFALMPMKIFRKKMIRCEACGRRWQVRAWKLELLRTQCPSCRLTFDDRQVVGGTELAIILAGLAAIVLIWI